MTWDPTKPANNESPSKAPKQIRDNWSRLQAIITKDHLFATSSSTSEGYHKVIHWQKSSDPSYINGTSQTYAKDADLKLDGTDVTTSHLFHRTTDGTTNRENPITPIPALAYVNFDGRSSNDPCTVNSQYNVSKVARTSKGNYTITFENNLPSTAYVALGSSEQSDVSTDFRGTGIITRVKAAGSLQITASARGGNFDPPKINVVVFGG